MQYLNKYGQEYTQAVIFTSKAAAAEYSNVVDRMKMPS